MERVDDLDFGVRLTWNIGFLVFFFLRIFSRCAAFLGYLNFLRSI